MKRDPGLHVTKSVLREVIRDIVGEHIDYVGITNYIFSKCRGKSVHHRSIVITDEAIQKKVSRVLLSGADDTSLFSTLLVTCRRKLKHKGISQAKPMSRDWLVLKEISSKALQFCEDFELPRREGFIKYIEIGLSRIQKFNLNRLNSMSEAISNIYESMEELKSDTTPQLTTELYKYYNKLVIERSGIPIDYTNFPEKMVYFFRIKLVARDCRIDAKTYIDAQFKAFEYNNSIPEPTQMVGDKAKIRLTKHLYNIGGETILEEAPKRDWKKILNS